jgi:hypothetical protein
MVPKSYDLRMTDTNLEFEITGEKSTPTTEILTWYEATEKSTKAYVYLAERENQGFNTQITTKYDEIINLPNMSKIKTIYVMNGDNGDQYAKLDVKKDLKYMPVHFKPQLRM